MGKKIGEFLCGRGMFITITTVICLVFALMTCKSWADLQNIAGFIIVAELFAGFATLTV